LQIRILGTFFHLPAAFVSRYSLNSFFVSTLIKVFEIIQVTKIN
jgi:hypothetical protein